MTLQDIVDKYENGLKSGKTKAQKPGFGQGKKPRRNFYYDIKYVRDLEMSGANDYDLLFACVFNRDRHLWMLSKKNTIAATQVLYKGKVLNGIYNDFDELYDTVRHLIEPIDGIGEVAFYDIALRLGSLKRFQLYPTNKVYYHSYLRESARKLLGLSRISSFRMEVSNFRTILPNMPAIFIEDMLCSMHSMICPESKKYNGKAQSPLSQYGPFSKGTTPVNSQLTINAYFK